MGFGVNPPPSPPSGVTSTIAGLLNLTGNLSGNDQLNIEDAADSLPRVATMSASSLTGVSPAAIGYSGFASLELDMGTANSSLTISDTIAGHTEIMAGTGSNTITLLHDSGSTDIRATNSTIAIQTTGAAAGHDLRLFVRTGSDHGG